MRKVLVYFGMFAVFALFFTSCGGTNFDESQLIGKWKDDTQNEFYRYFPNGTGHFWNEDDDVTEAEARKFDWSLNGSELEHNYHSIMVDGPLVTRFFTLKILNSTTLKYRDDFVRRDKSFTKVRE